MPYALTSDKAGMALPLPPYRSDYMLIGSVRPKQRDLDRRQPLRQLCVAARRLRA